MSEKTLAIIKPDAVEKQCVGDIVSMYEKSGLKIMAMQMFHLSKKQAQAFYDVHIGKSFYESLTDFMSSGPIVALVLAGEDAITRNRTLMGSTNPVHAAQGTIRKKYATNIERNAVHGSDAPETAVREISFFFTRLNCI